MWKEALNNIKDDKKGFLVQTYHEGSSSLLHKSAAKSPITHINISAPDFLDELKGTI